jgi:hypothetical protein
MQSSLDRIQQDNQLICQQLEQLRSSVVDYQRIINEKDRLLAESKLELERVHIHAPQTYDSDMVQTNNQALEQEIKALTVKLADQEGQMRLINIDYEESQKQLFEQQNTIDNLQQALALAAGIHHM